MTAANAWPPPLGSVWRLPDGRIVEVVDFYRCGDDGRDEILRLRSPDGGPKEEISRLEWELWKVAAKRVEL